MVMDSNVVEPGQGADAAPRLLETGEMRTAVLGGDVTQGLSSGRGSADSTLIAALESGTMRAPVCRPVAAARPRPSRHPPSVASGFRSADSRSALATGWLRRAGLTRVWASFTEPPNFGCDSRIAADVGTWRDMFRQDLYRIR